MKIFARKDGPSTEYVACLILLNVILVTIQLITVAYWIT